MINLSQVDEVANAVDVLADYLISIRDDPSELGLHVGSQFLTSNFYLDLPKPVYQGTFTWLHDIGYMAENIATFCNNYQLMNTGLMTKANALKTALQSAITYTWREGPYDNASLYYGAGTECPYGMTIAGSALASNGTNLVDGYAPDFYKTDLDFGKGYSWGDLLEFYFGTDYNNIGILRR